MRILPEKEPLFLKGFPVLPFLEMSAPGLELGTNSVTYFEARKEGKLSVPAVFDHIPLKKECVVGTMSDISECNELVEALEHLVKKHDIKKANVTIPEEEVYVFSTTLYLEEGQAIEAALISQIEKNVPFSPDDVTYDYQIVKEKGDARIVSVVASSKKSVQTYEALLEQVGITPIRAMSENQAMINALLKTADGEPHIVVYISKRRAVFSICENGVVQLTSSISFDHEFSGDVNKDTAVVGAIQKKISQILMHWYSTKGKKQNAKMHHMLVYSFSSDTTHDLMVYLKRFFPHLGFHSGTPWENMFDLEDYLPEITKDDAFLFVKAIGASLVK